MSNSVGLTPGAAGIQPGGSAVGASPATYGGPYIAPQFTSAQRLQNQSQVDDIAQSSTQSRLMAVQTANSLRQQTAGTAHAISEQAVSTSQEQIGDMIAEAKKTLDNAGKAV